MSVVLKYGLAGNLDGNTNERIAQVFEVFGWRRSARGTFTYYGAAQGDDWFNAILPPMMWLRGYILAKDLHLKTWSVGVSEAEGDVVRPIQPIPGGELLFAEPSRRKMRQRLIRDWLIAADAVRER